MRNGVRSNLQAYNTHVDLLHQDNSYMGMINLQDIHLTEDRKRFIESKFEEEIKKLEGMKVPRGTRSNYESSLRWIRAFHRSESCKNLPVYILNQQLMDAFIAFLTNSRVHRYKQNPLSNGTIMIILQSFLTVLQRWRILYTCHIPDQAMGKQRKTAMHTMSDEIWTEEEIEQIWALPLDDFRGRLPTTAHCTRDKTLIAIYCGARIGEVTTIFATKDTDKTDLLGIFAPKTSEPRYVPMHPRIKHLIERGWYKLPKYNFGMLKNMLIITGQGQEVRRSGNQVFRTIVPRKTIISFHSCRKTFAVRMIEAGTDIYYLSKLMGHSSVAVTEQYYAMVKERSLAKVATKAFANIK